MSVSRDGCVHLWDVFSGTRIDSRANLNMTMLTKLAFMGPSKVSKADLG